MVFNRFPSHQPLKVSQTSMAWNYSIETVAWRYDMDGDIDGDLDNGMKI